MEENKSVWKNGMIYGAFLGVTLVILSLVFNAMQIKNSNINTIFTLLILGTWLVIGAKKYRSNLGGFVSYSGALGASVVIMLFAAVISAFFAYLFLTVIEPDTIANSIVEMENNMIENGDDDETIQKAITMYKKFASPGFFALVAFLGNMIMGFLVSLITSIFVKRKNPNPFSGIGNDQIIDSEIR